MEKKLKTIDYELEQTEKRLEDLLAGIKQLRKEVHDMLPKEVKKVVHERVTFDRYQLDQYIKVQDYLKFWIGSSEFTLVNITRYKDYNEMLFKCKVQYKPYETLRLAPLNETLHSQVIITFIPSINTVYVVER